MIQNELVEDFKSDYDSVVTKALDGLERLEARRLDFSFNLAELEHGKVQVTGKGLFMTVAARGTIDTKVKSLR